MRTQTDTIDDKLLLRTQIVLVRENAHVAFGKWVNFRTADFQTPHDDVDRFFKVRLTAAVWHDMGSPETITVTIEPGDRLNDLVHQGIDSNVTRFNSGR
jgi:hypothetical protein